MYRRQKKIVFLSFVFLLSIPLLSRVSALSLVQAKWSDLLSQSDCVVTARIQSIRAEACNDPGLHGVQTRIHLDRVQVLRGTASEALDVILPGGKTGGRDVKLPGAPEFRTGENTVLLLRKLEVNEFALVGYGLGVLRRSEDGSWIKPDIQSEGGPSDTGESFQNFTARFGIVTPAGASKLNRIFFGAAAALVLALLVVFLFRKFRSSSPTAMVLIIFCAGTAMLSRSAAKGDSVAPRFGLTGQTWNLNNFLPNRVEDGKVLWLRGQGSKDLSDTDAFNAIERQINQWGSIPGCAISFVKSGRSVDAGQSIDDKNTISFLKQLNRKIFDKNTLAITFTQSADGSKEIVDADIVFNDKDFHWVVDQGAGSLETVALHESGHFIGMAHSTDPADVMFPVAGGLRVLSAGDRAGALVLYPAGADGPPPAASIAASPAAGVAPLAVSFVSLVPSTLKPTISWDFGDGSPLSSDPQPQHTYATAGTFTATLYITDIHSRSASSSVAIVVSGSSGAATVKKLTFEASLFSPQNSGLPRKDKLNLLLQGIDARPGDRIAIFAAGTQVGVIGADGHATLPVVLDDKASFRGDSNLGGPLQLKFAPKSRELNVTLSKASLGLSFDPRPLGDNSQAGKATLPLVVQVSRADGTSIAYTLSAQYSFKIKLGKVEVGTVERMIQGKL